jgi:serine/threonine-protein kinase RsbW
MSVVTSNRVYEADFPAEPQVVHVVRERVDEFARPLGLSEDELDAFRVALSEAFSNAVCHGSPLGPRNRVHLRCEADSSQLSVQITDEGGGFVPTRIALPDFEEWKTSGRGLFLMFELVDQVEFELVPGGTRVKLIKRLPPRDRTEVSEAVPVPLARAEVLRFATA